MYGISLFGRFTIRHVCDYNQPCRIVAKKRLAQERGPTRKAPLSSTHLDLGLEAGAAELVHLFDVLLHSVLLSRTLALGPLIKLGLGLLVEEAAGPGCEPQSSNINRKKTNTRTHADEDTGGAGGALGQAPERPFRRPYTLRTDDRKCVLHHSSHCPQKRS